MNPSSADEDLYKVVVNDEEQFSIWPTWKSIPLGWRDAGMTANKAKCLQHIEAVWTDMRPLSLRKAMGSAEEGTSDA